ncbi:baiF CoA-transferase family protein DDB_G0269880 [Seminavis robusta]|uniref:BaiF CoA-transferase family protein DDB_G0269880 n=1 Tax=Seminavis robusta TaxID=568900 RepID=A0A9N8HL57_9STRA|nr:baiF CoA-transferase family protein DDB_G0269880 [Seminavis robusta]|eukprot:Sro799_g204140.1 baiF CoA-transferase family protein DDB_G0269880 (416) ;mRNA; r:29782-31029
MATQQLQKPLTGVRVVDFSRVLAGPFLSMMLGDLGAEVIKIEHPKRGDDTRAWGPPFVHGMEDKGMSAYFACVNRNKKSLALDLKDKRGAAVAKRLVTDPKTHIVVENFKVGGMGSYGLDYATVSKIHPALIMCSVTGFGQTGPYKDRPGYDLAIQAMSGLMSITGQASGEPQKVGVAISDVIAGLFAGNGVLAALYQAEKTGVGQHVDISLLDTQISSLVNIASNYLTTKQVPTRMSNAHPTIVPYQDCTASDGYFVIACGNDGQFAKLASLLEHPEWATDEKFATNPARVRNREELMALLNTEFSKQTATSWVERLLEVGVPAAPINDMGQALNDEHIRARGLVQELTFKDEAQNILGSIEMVGSPLKLSGSSMERVESPPPFVGEHTEEVLRDILSMDELEIASLRDSGVIR